jgi:hypothetical protein
MATLEEKKNVERQENTIPDYRKIRNKKILEDTGHTHEVHFFIRSGLPEGRVRVCYWVTDYLNDSSIFSDNGIFNDPDIVYMIISRDVAEEIYNISLYSIEESAIDVSEIASFMGGGGHFHSASFTAVDVYAKVLSVSIDPDPKSMMTIYQKKVK